MKRLMLLLLLLVMSIGVQAQIGDWTLYYSDTEQANSDNTVTVTPTVSVSGDDGGWCNNDVCWGWETPSVMVNNNPWAFGPEYNSGFGPISYAHTFPSVVMSDGTIYDLSYAAKVGGIRNINYNGGWYGVSPYPWYVAEFIDGFAPSAGTYPVGTSPCVISEPLYPTSVPFCAIPFPALYGSKTGQADLFSDSVSRFLQSVTVMVQNNGLSLNNIYGGCQPYNGVTLCAYDTTPNCVFPAGDLAWWGPSAIKASQNYADWLVKGVCFKVPGVTSILFPSSTNGWVCPPTTANNFNIIMTETLETVVAAYPAPQPPSFLCTPKSYLLNN